MWSYFARRFLLAIPTLLFSTLIVFLVVQKAPGGPVEAAIMASQMGGGQGEAGGGAVDMANNGVSQASIDAIKKYYDLDKPIHVRFYRWGKKILRLDFGVSSNFGKPVWDMLKGRFKISISLGLLGFFLSYMICIPLGIFKAIKHNGYFDFGSSVLVFAGYSIPGWAFGMLALMYFASPDYGYEWFPLNGIQSSPDVFKELSTWGKLMDYAHHAILPVGAYMLGSFARLTILTKNSLMENLGQDYVRTAFAKGLPERRVIVVHAMRNSLIPLATGLGHIFSLVLAGSYLIESVFQIEGMGMLGFKAIINKDINIVMGILVISTALSLFGNIVQDVLYCIFDPRIRFK
ncbi:MAG: ABC transporter permease [Planctomycetota bacterium]|nr:ABC transporter permease [Planctomycetota bacterium]